MAGTTSIGWTDSTPNVLTHRCKPVADECDHCYAQTHTNRFEGEGAFTSEPPALVRPKLLLPWLDPGVRAGQRAFLSSMSDPGHPAIPVDDLALIFAMMAADQTNDWQVPTKRPHVLAARLNHPAFAVKVRNAIPTIVGMLADTRSGRLSRTRREGIERIRAAQAAFTWPLPNVWIGVSAGSQASADKFIPVLMKIPARVRFVSVEPMIGPVDLTRIAGGSRQQPGMVWDVLNRRYGVPGRWQAPMTAGIDWVILGGESGHHARPMHITWLQDAIGQAQRAGVPVFFKQWGAWAPAPWRVPLDDDVVRRGGEDLAAAKAAAEKTGATHSYPVDAHLHGHVAYRPPHKPWSVERTALPPGHVGVRRFAGHLAGNLLNKVRLEEFPESHRLHRPRPAPRRDGLDAVTAGPA